MAEQGTEQGAPNPLEALPEPPAVAKKTIAINGILVDIYGLDDVPSGLTHVSVLWLHNPRMGNKERMGPIAQRAVGEYNRTRAAGSTRALIAVAFGEWTRLLRSSDRLEDLPVQQLTTDVLRPT